MSEQESSVLLETIIRDWRAADGSEASIRPEHRGDFAVKISRTPYDGLMIEFVTPQGEAHAVLVEAVSGAVKLATYTTDPEEPGWTRDGPDARILLTPGGTLVEEDHGVDPLVVRFVAEERAEKAEPFKEVWEEEERDVV